MTHTRVLAILAVILLGASAGMSAQPLADKVPAGSLAYMGWAGRSLTFDGSMLGQLLAEPGLESVFQAIRKAAASSLAEDPDSLATFESLWAMGGIAWQHPVALALVDLTLPPAGGEGGDSDEPLPVGVILIDLQKDRAAFAAQLQKLLATVAKKLELSRVAVGDQSYHRFDTPAGPCAMGFVGDIFFVSIGEGMPTRIAAVAAGKADSLGNDAKFQAAMKEVAGENEQLSYYLDVSRLLAIIEKMEPVGPAEPKAAEGDGSFRKILKASGVDGVTALAGTVRIVDRGVYEKCRIFSPAPHRGMMLLMAGKPLGPDALAWIPADADVAAVMNLDPSRLLAEIKRVAGVISPDAASQLDGVLATASEAVGVDIENELLAHMGDEWTFVSAPSLGGTLTGTAASVQLKDPAAFSAALAKLEAQLEQTMGALVGAASAPAEGPGGQRPTIRRYKSGDIEVHYVSAPGLPSPIAPAWAVHKGRFYVAAFPQVVAAAAGGSAVGPLTKSQDFIALRKRLSPNASMLTYTNTPAMVRRLYGLILLGGTAGANMLGGFTTDIRPEVLPPLPKVEKYLWPEMSAISADEKGILMESYGSLPAAFSSSLSQLPLQLPVIGVSLSRARMLAKRALSGGNLNGIYKGLLMYGAEHGDQVPPDLAALIDSSVIPGKMLYSHNSGRTPRLDEKGKPVGPIDYVYLGAQLGSLDVEGDLILAYERPEINRGKGTNVLYASGQVKWVSMAQFELDLARTKDYINKRKAGEQVP